MKMTNEEALDFVWDRKNIRNCSNCPFNQGNRNGLPCGQQNCWVAVHVALDEKGE